MSVQETRLPEPLRPLERIAWNYWWSWTPGGTAVFRDLDPFVWEECEHNPRRLLAESSEVRLTEMATDPDYVARVQRLSEEFDKYMEDGRRWWPPEGSTKIRAERP
ncbi:MAG TPA: DUF3417 domain-containing protein, partial [Pyrinomonadaceae bacterium]|nr:DUF3417 domain-containing protein [Pyrinomonadaceae bacterium]